MIKAILFLLINTTRILCIQHIDLLLIILKIIYLIYFYKISNSIILLYFVFKSKTYISYIIYIIYIIVYKQYNYPLNY